MSLFGESGHHLQIFVGDDIPNSWVMWKNRTFTNPCWTVGYDDMPVTGLHILIYLFPLYFQIDWYFEKRLNPGTSKCRCTLTNRNQLLKGYQQHSSNHCRSNPESWLALHILFNSIALSMHPMTFYAKRPSMVIDGHQWSKDGRYTHIEEWWWSTDGNSSVGLWLPRSVLSFGGYVMNDMWSVLVWCTWLNYLMNG